MIGNQHLTTVDPTVEATAAHTHPGQAHFAELTSRHSCGECSWFQPILRNNQRGRCRKAANVSMKSLFAMPRLPGCGEGLQTFRGL